jgi:hypothetical protein
VIEVSAADFHANIRRYYEIVQTEPIAIRKNGKLRAGLIGPSTLTQLANGIFEEKNRKSLVAKERAKVDQLLTIARNLIRACEECGDEKGKDALTYFLDEAVIYLIDNR